MPPLSDLLGRLSGKKTYLAAAGAAALAAYHAWRGEYAEAQKFAVLALGFAGLRHAMDKRAPAEEPAE